MATPWNRPPVDASGDGGKGVVKYTRPQNNFSTPDSTISGDVTSRGETTGDPFQQSNRAPVSQPNRRRSRKNRKRKHQSQAGETVAARGMRMPPQKAPDVAYVPVNGKKRDTKSPAGTGPLRNEQRQSVKHARHTRQKPEPYAALDLGTNNCRLLVALPQERGRFRVIDGFSRIVRLGEGLGRSDRLSDVAMDRALDALKICSQKLVSHGIRRHRLIATEACRQALNGADFLERVRVETGMKLEIINRQTEAHLAAQGCGSLMDRKADAAVLFDIGGGSSELVLMDRRQRKARIADQIAGWTSLPVGVVTLAERHGGREVTRAVFDEMVAEVRDHIDAFEGRAILDKVWQSGRVHLLGTSGTVTTLAGIHLGLPRYERRLVDGLWMETSDVDRVVNELLAMSYEERAASPCVGTERADLVMAGCAILEAIRQTWPSRRLRVADRGLREGILTEMMERDAAWLPPKANRRRRHSAQQANPNHGTPQQKPPSGGHPS